MSDLNQQFVLYVYGMHEGYISEDGITPNVLKAQKFDSETDCEKRYSAEKVKVGGEIRGLYGNTIKFL